MEFISGIVDAINGFFWGSALIVLLCGTGIYFTVRLKFIQVRQFGAAFKRTFGSISFSGEKAGAEGMTSFQALATALAAQVGTGNLAGAATALIAGGPGAIFWMWVSAFFGMATIFAEAVLAQNYKSTDANGVVTGGPVFYIQAAFKGVVGKFLAILFAIFIIFALGFMGNMVQANSIGAAFSNAFGVNPMIVGIVCAVLAAFIFVGGVGRIASFTEKVVPIMAAFYILGALIILIVNIQNVPLAFTQIFVAAFDPRAVVGGGLGVSIQAAIRFGVSRGLFSNEAGMGSTPHAHAIAKVKHPCEQGQVAMMGVFFDTFVVVTLTALVILTSGILDNQIYNLSSASLIPETLKGVGLSQSAFENTFGHFGIVFIAICMLFFAFSTIVGWYFFGEANVKFLFGDKATKLYALIVVIVIIIGSTLKVDLVWSMADCFNGLMVIPNLLGVLALGGVVIKLSKEFDSMNKK